VLLAGLELVRGWIYGQVYQHCISLVWMLGWFTVFQ
jgi:hypothetical protein